MIDKGPDRLTIKRKPDGVYEAGHRNSQFAVGDYLRATPEREAAPDLKEALEEAVQTPPDAPLYCNGMKCNEAICAECNVVEDASAELERVRDACIGALAKARGEEE